MSSSRIKGQEIQIDFLVNGVTQEALTDIRSFEVSGLLEILTEGYLGEKTDRRDDIFHGVRGTMEVHFESQDILFLARELFQRAKSRDPGVTVNIRATLNFPNGENPKILIRDAYFGEIPFNFASRSDYGVATLDFEASDFKVITN